MLVPQGPAVPARAAETPAKESQEKERKDDGRERPKGVHLKDNPGKKNSQQRALGKTADPGGRRYARKRFEWAWGWRVRNGH